MFEDYQLLVMEDYLQKKKQGSMSLNLVHPTAARLKKECQNVCETRFDLKDSNLLVSLFKKHDGADGYRSAIKKMDDNSFKALEKYLKGSSKATSEKNIELLAWLIDFQPRPYKAGYAYPAVTPAVNAADHEPATEAVATENTVPVDEPEEKREPVKNLHLVEAPSAADPVSNKAGNRFSKRIIAASIVLFATACFGVYWLIKTPVENNRCMYWKDNHYQKVPCSKKISDATVLALDSDRAARFEKVVLPDTITENSVGRLWYIKLNNQLEYYTMDGFHPVHTERKLKPLTSYIVQKYVHHKAVK